MSFTLETTDMDLGDTLVENIFINDYMPMANGTYVKVYLLGYKYATDRDKNMEVDNQVIAKHLQISMEDVVSAWDFWESKGIIKKYDLDENDRFKYKVKFLNLKQLYIKNNYSLKSEEVVDQEIKKPTNMDVIEANKSKRNNEMFNKVNHYLKRQTQIGEKKEILDWMWNYNMTPEMIEMAFAKAVDNPKVNKSGIFKYVNGILRNWYDGGITNIEKLEEYSTINNERHYNYINIFKALGRQEMPSDPEKETMDRWLDQYGFSMDVILKACEEKLKSGATALNYYEAILSNWHREGVKTVEDAELASKKHQEGNKSKFQYDTNPASGAARPNKPIKENTKFHNFKQRPEAFSEDKMEEVVKRKREEYMKSIKGES